MHFDCTFMRIVEVTNRKQLKEFVAFPDRLYRDCPQYVPALHSDQIRSLTSCAPLEYCSHRLWLAVDEEGKTLGRISAMINPRYNELYGKKCCRFGWFDTVEDFAVAKALVDTASAWAAENGMKQIHGPLYYNTLGKQGMLVEGFENTPQFNTIYNYPYYPEFLERMGFIKECDWIQSVVEGVEVPERLVRIADRLKERYKLRVADVDKLVKDEKKVQAFIQMYSDSFYGSVYNFIPFTESEKKELARESLSMISDRSSTVIVDEDGEVAAFGIANPSISGALKKAKGHLFPFGWFYILKALYGRNDTMDMLLNGASPKWQGKGLNALLHCYSSVKFAKAGVRYSISNPQIETNSAAKVWEGYDTARPFMRRRCYIKDLD